MTLQTELPGLDTKGLRDPYSADNKGYPMHRWVPWIAGYSAAFVRDVLGRFLPSGNHYPPLVLDPFCGIGTTLVESLFLGADSVGFEINPYAILASRVKADAIRLDPELLNSKISLYQDWMSSFEDGLVKQGPKYLSTLTSTPPPSFKTRIPFYSDRVLWRALATMDFIRSDAVDESLRDLFLTAFSSTMVSYSNYSYEPSLATRPGSGKPLVEDAPVADLIVSKLEQMRSDITRMRIELAGSPHIPHVAIHQDSFFDAPRYIEDGIVDLVVTSPPCLNNYHYVRNTRPQLWWLVRDRAELRDLEFSNFGKLSGTVTLPS